MATQLSGDPRDRAFEDLYERYVKDVYRYALAVMRNPADAEDVTQTTFMNAYKAFKDGEEPIKPQHWLIKIAHNACCTRAIRASRRPREVPLDETVGELAVPDQDRPSIKAILGALGRLPFNQRSALVMRELEGRSYEEIAETLGVSVSAVETLIFRARRSLRLKRDSLRGLLLVPLPASLESFGGGAVATGGLALGGGVVAKAAAVVAALIAGGASYQAVDATIGGHRSAVRPHAQTITILAAAGMPLRGPAVRMHALPSIRPTPTKRAAHNAAAPAQHPAPNATISTLPAPQASAPAVGGQRNDGGAGAGTPHAAAPKKRVTVLPVGDPVLPVPLPVPTLPLPTVTPPAPPVAVPAAPPVAPAVPPAPGLPSFPPPPSSAPVPAPPNPPVGVPLP